jgi:SAM-dependent methyltransferase
MGIGRGGARLLLAEAAKRPFSGRVLQLGRQHLFFNKRDLEGWAAIHGVQLSAEFVNANKRPPLLDASFIDDGSFFARIGFSQVESCDISIDEAPTYAFDLNGQIPDELAGVYDAVFDGGTLEHVFNVPNALQNIHKLLKVGGRIVHLSPSSNHVDHGFYMFSPTLFFDYYAANKYGILEAQIFEYTKNHEVDPWNIYNYEPGSIEDLSCGGFDRGYLLGIWVVARKTTESICHAIPQQGMYLRRWRDQELAKVRDEQYRDHARTSGEASWPKKYGMLRRLKTQWFGPRPRSLDAFKVAEY